MGLSFFFPSSQILHLPRELKLRRNDPALSWPNQVRFSQNFLDTFFYLKITFFDPKNLTYKKLKKNENFFNPPPKKKNFFDLKKDLKKTKTFSTPPQKNFFRPKKKKKKKKKTFSPPPQKNFFSQKKKKKKKKKS